MAMIDITALLTLSDAYQAATGVPETTVSHRLFNDTKKLALMRVGADITVGRFNHALLWFSANWPEGCDWPDGVARPEPAVQSPEAAE
jgi:hypothetical protein